MRGQGARTRLPLAVALALALVLPLIGVEDRLTRPGTFRIGSVGPSGQCLLDDEPDASPTGACARADTASCRVLSLFCGERSRLAEGYGLRGSPAGGGEEA